MCGTGVHKLMQEMQKQGIPGSPLRTAPSRQDAVCVYRAPKELGGSAVAILLHGTTPLWTREEFLKLIDSETRPIKVGMPDVMIALNAGIGSYPSWNEVADMAHIAGIPFAVTDYLEITLDTCADRLVRA